VELTYAFEQTPPAGTMATVAPGIHWARMPLPFALDHINLWVLEDEDGWTLIDSGIALDGVRDCWERLFAGALAGRPVRRLIVTHFHPDHLGLGQWLAQRHGVEVWMTLGEYLTAHAVANQTAGHAVPDMVAQFERHGLDAGRRAALAARGNAYRKVVPALPEHYRRMFDGEEIRIGARTWRVAVGYGHSPEHAALHCEEAGVLVSGDMVLPRISTNIPVFAANPLGNPLQLYLDSLTRYARLGRDTLVLPSHGLPFHGLQTRVEQLHAHHRERCAALIAATGEPRSAGELLATLFPRELDTHQVMFAMGEAIAHLNYLEHAGATRRIECEDGITRFVSTH
jgi:glyoxylase-like metal-dependent hydrolase (beta-lactamase superfamily II)